MGMMHDYIRENDLEGVKMLLECGVDPNETSEGLSALALAHRKGLSAIIIALLDAGAVPDASPHKWWETEDRDVLLAFLAHGADPTKLDREAQRTLLGLVLFGDEALAEVTREQFEQGKETREGKGNPEELTNPFRLAMIRCGWSGFGAGERFGARTPIVLPWQRKRPSPIWCADRFGQSFTMLSDGRTIMIGGEHEDYYDPDFCIYNDVFVFHPAGEIRIYGYPFAVFPPTDFHTATLVGPWIYVIGCLGYQGQRERSLTTFRLSLDDYHIERVETTGITPPQLYKHRATLINPNCIKVEGGKTIKKPNSRAFLLDLQSMTWSEA